MLLSMARLTYVVFILQVTKAPTSVATIVTSEYIFHKASVASNHLKL